MCRELNLANLAKSSAEVTSSASRDLTQHPATPTKKFPQTPDEQPIGTSPHAQHHQQLPPRSMATAHLMYSVSLTLGSIYETNYSNVEKMLPMKVNFKKALRLLLRGGHLHDDPELTAEIRLLCRACPTLSPCRVRIGARLTRRPVGRRRTGDRGRPIGQRVACGTLRHQPDPCRNRPSQPMVAARSRYTANQENFPVVRKGLYTTDR